MSSNLTSSMLQWTLDLPVEILVDVEIDVEVEGDVEDVEVLGEVAVMVVTDRRKEHQEDLERKSLWSIMMRTSHICSELTLDLSNDDIIVGIFCYSLSVKLFGGSSIVQLQRKVV